MLNERDGESWVIEAAVPQRAQDTWNKGNRQREKGTTSVGTVGSTCPALGLHYVVGRHMLRPGCHAV